MPDVLSYETLDQIADLVNPVSGVLCLLHAVASQPRTRPAVFGRLACVLGFFAFAKGLEYVDAALGLWPTAGLDYSTHAAVAVGILAYVVTRMPVPWRVAGVLVFIAYAMLMLYQRYHSLADIVTTLVAVGSGCVAIEWVRRQRRKGEAQSTCRAAANMSME